MLNTHCVWVLLQVWKTPIYSLSRCRQVQTPVITGVWNLSTSTDYICCIVVFLVYVITPIGPMGVITGVWNLSTSTDYICCTVV